MSYPTPDAYFQPESFGLSGVLLAAELTDDTWGEFTERLNAWCQYDWRDDDDRLGKVRMLRHEMMVAAVKAMQS